VKFAKRSAIEPEKLPKYRLRNLNFELDFFDAASSLNKFVTPGHLPTLERAAAPQSRCAS
jgi:hypothetical protein